MYRRKNSREPTTTSGSGQQEDGNVESPLNRDSEILLKRRKRLHTKSHALLPVRRLCQLFTGLSLAASFHPARGLSANPALKFEM